MYVNMQYIVMSRVPEECLKYISLICSITHTKIHYTATIVFKTRLSFLFSSQQQPVCRDYISTLTNEEEGNVCYYKHKKKEVSSFLPCISSVIPVWTVVFVTVYILCYSCLNCYNMYCYLKRLPHFTLKPVVNRQQKVDDFTNDSPNPSIRTNDWLEWHCLCRDGYRDCAAVYSYNWGRLAAYQSSD